MGSSESDLPETETPIAEPDPDQTDATSDDSGPSLEGPMVDGVESDSDSGAAEEEATEGVEELRLMSRKTFLLLCLGLVVAYPVLTFLDVWFASTRDGSVTGEAAIVMGAAQYNGEPSPVLRGRLDQAAELFQDGSVTLVVVTGGAQQGDASTEANAGYVYLRREAGLADEDIRLEVQGASTYESLAATSRFLQREDVTDVVLVTDPFHAKRASLVAQEVGLNTEVSLTSSPAGFERLAKETGAVAVGRIIGFRRLEQFTG